MSVWMVLLWAGLVLGAVPCTETWAEPPTPPGNSGQFLPVSGGSVVPIDEILHLSTDHLFALGAGILMGATFIAPQLEVSELAGIIIGVIGGDLLYRIFFPSRRHWFPSGWF